MCYLILLPTLSGTRRLSAPTILFMFRHILQALPCLPNTANIGAYNIVCALTRLEGCKVPVWHGLVAPSYRCAGYGRVRSLVLLFDFERLTIPALPDP